MTTDILYEDKFFQVINPQLPLNCRKDGGHLILIKKDKITDRSDMTYQEAIDFIGGYKEQAFSSLSTWTFNHNLGVQYPEITVVDSNDKKFIPLDIEYVSTSQCVITHTIAKTGIAIANTTSLLTPKGIVETRTFKVSGSWIRHENG